MTTGNVPPTGNVQPPKDDDEVIYYEGYPLLRGDMGRLLLFTLIGAAMFVLPLFLRFSAGTQIPGLLMIALMAVGIGVIVVPVLMQRTSRFRISNYRIDVELGILSKTIDTLERCHA